MEEPQGYLHNKLDVKVLILFILARIDFPLTVQDIYEVAYQDDSLNYFVLAESLPELVTSGHLTMDDNKRYTITEKGREQGAQVEDSLAIPVVQKVTTAIAQKLTQLRREDYITAEVFQDDSGNWIASLRYMDDGMPMMTLSMLAPNEELANKMALRLRKNADLLYKTNLDIAIDERQERKS